MAQNAGHNVPDAAAYRSWWDGLRDPALTTMLVVLCLIIFIAAPCVTMGGHWAGSALEALLLLSALLVVLISRNWLVATIAAFAMLVAVVGSACDFVVSSPTFALAAQIGLVIGSIVAAFVIGTQVFAPGAITAHRVLGAIVLYLNFGMIFSGSYRLLWTVLPSSLSGIPAGTPLWQASGTILYFSFVTLTTVGYGDIVPVHPIARSLTNLEAIIGQLFPATLLARLITLQLEHRRR